MNIWPLILHLITATPAANVSYDLSNGILNNVEVVNVKSINLSHLHIKHIAANSLDTLDEVETLDLSNNDLVDLPPLIFSNLANLKELSLFNNSISSFNKTFIGLMNLERLNIAQNPIKFLNRGDFFGLPKSVKIISQSTEPITISSALFKEPSSAVRINNNEKTLSKNENKQHSWYDNFSIQLTDFGVLEAVESNRFNDRNDSIEITPIIDLSTKGISSFEDKWFQVNNSYYNEINLWANDIHQLSAELLNNLSPSIKRIDLGYNHITALRKNYRIQNNTIELDLTANDLSIIEAGAFGQLNLLGLNLDRNLFKSTAFVKILPTTIRVLELDENHVTEIPLESFFGLVNLEYLSITYNHVVNIEPGTFKDQKNLKTLLLMNNEINELKSGFFRGLDRLEMIDLGGNHIKNIPSDLFVGLKPNPTKFSLELGGNLIKTIGDAFCHMDLVEIRLNSDELNDDSIGEGTFNGSNIESIHLTSETFTRFNGEWFKGISGLTNVDLHSNSVKKIEKGFCEHMKSVKSLFFGVKEINLGNGALFGLSMEDEVEISVYEETLMRLEGGLFDDL